MKQAVPPEEKRGSLLLPVIRRRRIFSASRGQRRFRRASDLLLLVLASLGLAVLVAAYPPSGAEQSLIAFLKSLPQWLDPAWVILYDAFSLWVVVLVLATAISRRGVVALHAAASTIVSGALSLVVFRIAVERWPDLDFVLRLRVEDTTFPVLRVAVGAAIVLAISPHLIRPLQTVSRWMLAVGVLGAILAEEGAPSAVAAALLVAVVAATAVRYAFGTSAGYPETSDVIASLAELGVEVRSLEPAARQPAGLFIARGEDADGRSLLVKVYGRDAYDTQLLEKAWRTLWYRGDGPRVRLSRLQAVEHEALVTLLASQAGVPTREVVIAGESSSGDALLVFRDTSIPLGHLHPDEVDDERLALCWLALESLGDARIAHLRIDPGTVVAIGGGVGLVDFDAATVARRADQLLTDRAQLLATTAALVGAERAIGAAVVALGADGVAKLLAYLQPAAFDAQLRQGLKAAGVDTDELRADAAAAVGADAVEPMKLRRVTWWSLIQLALLVFAVSTIVGALSGLDYAALRSYLEDASWGWVVFGFVLAQLPRLTQSIATLGSVAVRLPFAPVYAMQLATGYMNLALPSNLARLAVNIRFFQRQGISPVTAVTAGAIDSFTSTIVQALLLGVLLIFSEASLNLGLDSPSGPSVHALLILLAILVGAVLTVMLVSRIRRAIVDRVRRWWPEVRESVVGLRGSHRLALLVGGAVATEFLFAAALGVFARAFGFDVGLADLLVINISVSLLASLIPVPGGIGVAEFGLTVGLVAAGLPEEAALAATLLYRAATFYLPPVWGFFALRWLQRNALL